MVRLTEREMVSVIRGRQNTHTHTHSQGFGDASVRMLRFCEYIMILRVFVDVWVFVMGGGLGHMSAVVHDSQWEMYQV